jgi:hypothetical protein
MKCENCKYYYSYVIEYEWNPGVEYHNHYCDKPTGYDNLPWWPFEKTKCKHYEGI